MKLILITKLISITLLNTFVMGYYMSCISYRYHRSVLSMAGGFGNKNSQSKGVTQKTKDSILKPKYEPKFADAKEPYQNHVPSFNPNYKGLRQIHHDPPIYEIDNFFTAEECQRYMELSQTDGFEIPSQTFSANAGSKRTSTTWFIKYEKVPEMISRIHQVTNIPIYNYEEPQIVRYELGQQFTWHYDYIPSAMLDNSGNRLVTVIIYLNNVINGGATCFKDLNIQVKPSQGKALIFFPCYRDGKNDERTLHAGQVAMDTKWIAQMWLHERPYSPKLPPGTNHDDGIQAIQNLAPPS